MDNLASRILNLVSRLSGREEVRSDPPAAPDQAATETAYRQALQRWFELTAQGQDAEGEEVARAYQEILRLLDFAAYRREHSIPPTRWWWYLDVVSHLPLLKDEAPDRAP